MIRPPPSWTAGAEVDTGVGPLPVTSRSAVAAAARRRNSRTPTRVALTRRVDAVPGIRTLPRRTIHHGLVSHPTGSGASSVADRGSARISAWHGLGPPARGVQGAVVVLARDRRTSR